MCKEIVRKAVIPAAGYGTRLLPITRLLPKAVLPLGTIPILSDILWEAYSAGIKEVFLITHWRENIIKQLFLEDFDELEKWLKFRGREDLAKILRKVVPQIDVHFIRQETLNGLGGAILLAEKFISEPFIVMLSDNIIIEEEKGSLLKILMKIYKTYKPSTVLSVNRVAERDIKRFGIISFSDVIHENSSEVYIVSDIVEKPDPSQAPSNLAVVGRYLFDPIIFDFLKEIPLEHGEIDETKAFKKQISYGHKVLAVNIGDRVWFDVGTIEGYLKAFLAFLIAQEGKDKIKQWIGEVL